MKRRAAILALTISPLMGCAHAHHTAPAVTAAPPPQPPEKTWLDRTGESTQHAADATWHVVTAPVRWATAKKPVTTRPATTAPDAVIVQSDADGALPIMIPLEEEPATRPTTRPKLH